MIPGPGEGPGERVVVEGVGCEGEAGAAPCHAAPLHLVGGGIQKISCLKSNVCVNYI